MFFYNRKYFHIAFICTFFSMIGCSEKENSLEKEEMDPVLVEGEQIVKKNCKVCHAQGINGAPVIGNAKMWEPRIKQDKSVLIQHAMEGFGLMPAKGGNSQLTEEEISKAVTYMLSQLK